MNLILDFVEYGGWVIFILLIESILGLAIIVNLTSLLFFKHPSINKVLFAKISRRAAWLSYLASLSTMTGLLGTVLGIYHSFRNMKGQGKISLESFSSGISEALLTTIYGLVLAILFVFFYHIFVDKIEDLEGSSFEQNTQN